jgi:hypothetical protein
MAGTHPGSPRHRRLCHRLATSRVAFVIVIAIVSVPVVAVIRVDATVGSCGVRGRIRLVERLVDIDLDPRPSGIVVLPHLDNVNAVVGVVRIVRIERIRTGIQDVVAEVPIQERVPRKDLVPIENRNGVARKDLDAVQVSIEVAVCQLDIRGECRDCRTRLPLAITGMPIVIGGIGAASTGERRSAHTDSDNRTDYCFLQLHCVISSFCC